MGSDSIEKSFGYSKPLEVHETSIPGMIWFDLPVHGDTRGWFKENWQRAKMMAYGLPDFGPVQNNISFNESTGTTRGLHAEPWDKFISVATGRVFGAWVDLRKGPTFGEKFTLELDPSRAIFVPRGVANGFQTLTDGSAYTYLVNAHWSADAQSQYTFLNLADKTIAINWPIPLDHAELSDKDKNHPSLSDVIPMKPKKTLILGGNGQVGRAFAKEFPEAEITTRQTLDITGNIENARKWDQYDTILNAAAYTKVDEAETPNGCVEAIAQNAAAVSKLSRIANQYGIRLVHISSDYVFDGQEEVHHESEVSTPQGVYGASKAAGDTAAEMTPNHYIIRPSWVVGDGNNFVRTMKTLAEMDKEPKVVNDQFGRLTFASEIARATRHLLDTGAEYGVYNLSSSGHTKSWFDIAADTFELCGYDRSVVSPTSTKYFYAGKHNIAPRPIHSTLDLTKIEATGFTPGDGDILLKQYLKEL